jgi:hypothetical protein
MYRIATPAKAITARPPTTLPAITPVLTFPEEEEELLSGAEVADVAALGVFEGDAPVCDDCVGAEEASDMTLEDGSAVVVAARCQFPTPHLIQRLTYPHKQLYSFLYAGPSSHSRCA